MGTVTKVKKIEAESVDSASIFAIAHQLWYDFWKFGFQERTIV